MYLIYRGSVQVTRDGNPLIVLREGAQPGRRALDTGENRNATLVTKEFTQILVLGKNDYQQCILVIPSPL